MELSKKTTILLPPRLHARLTRLARARRTSLGALIREACEATYEEVGREGRLEAVRELAALDLPVGAPEDMKAESVPSAEELLP